jgi:hypothetical protein
MGASRDDFTKFPRTPHLFGSIGTSDDKHMIRKKSLEFIADCSLIVEEKLDGTNVGIHFSTRRGVWYCNAEGMKLPAVCILSTTFSSNGQPVGELSSNVYLKIDWSFLANGCMLATR